MVKKLGIALLCAALGTTLYAREDISTSKLFIGLELESTNVDSSTDVFLGNDLKFSIDSDSTVEYGVRLGAEKEDWRTTLLYTYYNNTEHNNYNNKEQDREVTMNKGSMLLDYFLWSTGSSDYNIKPYIGAHIGYMSYEVSGIVKTVNHPDVNVIYADDTGLFYGGQAGIAMTISEVVELDLSYKYSLTSLDDMAVSINNTSLNNAVTSIDNMGSVAFSINYFY